MVVCMDPLGIVYKPVACIEPLYAEHPHYITLLLDRALTVVEHDRTLIQPFRNYPCYDPSHMQQHPILTNHLNEE